MAIYITREEQERFSTFTFYYMHTNVLEFAATTYATRCYENGVGQQVVQKLLGHSTLAMTADLYTHVSEEKKKEEVAELKNMPQRS
ncbi:MAG: tyrosine-type recombinase/integrase [Acetivibrio ethanolgignens]